MYFIVQTKVLKNDQNIFYILQLHGVEVEKEGAVNFSLYWNNFERNSMFWDFEIRNILIILRFSDFIG